MSVLRLFRAAFAVCGLALWLGACTVKLTQSYDPQIDRGLSSLNTDLVTFVTTMVAEARTPQGQYDNNKQFYLAAQAKLGTLRLRAETHRAMGECPSDRVVRDAVLGSVPATPPSGAFPSTLTAATVLAQLPPGDCEVGLLRLVSDGFGDLQRFHQAQGALGIPASAQAPILVGGVGSLLRSAITVEISKQSGKTVEGS